jgi:hypothetical protein
MTQSDKKKIKELQARILELESIHVSSSGYRYANMNHPRFRGKKGNPYLPLDENDNLRKGYVG